MTLSNGKTAAVNPALAVSDWNAQPRVHVVWLKARAGCAGDEGALYKSTDGGQTWGIDLLTNCHAQTSPNSDTDCDLTSLAIDRNNPNTLWIRQRSASSPPHAIMRSTDGGTTWVSRLTQYDALTFMALSPVNSNVAWALTGQELDGQWVRKTNDAGATWQSSKLDNTLNPVNRMILADLIDANAAWASGGGEGLFQSRDANATWHVIAPSFHALDLVVPQALYAVPQVYDSYASIQLSYDSGAHWFGVGEPGMVGMADAAAVQAISVARH